MVGAIRDPSRPTSFSAGFVLGFTMADRAVLLRHVDYTPMAWRNGAGTTLQIAREPTGGADFNWRLSLASIARSVPFSTYPGYRRAVALVDGLGLVLTV